MCCVQMWQVNWIVLHHQPQLLRHGPVVDKLCWIFWREGDPS